MKSSGLDMFQWFGYVPFCPVNCLQCCTLGPAVKPNKQNQGGSARMNQEFSHIAKPIPFLLKATTAVIAVNTALNCVITLKKPTLVHHLSLNH